MNTKVKVGTLVVVVLGVATVFLLQRVKIKRLGAENADLRTKLAQMMSLQDTNELLETQLKAAVETSQANQRELLRLRGQGVRTRQLEQENTQLRAQHRQLEGQVFESQSTGADYAFANSAGKRLQEVKTAVVDFYAKYGSLPSITNFIEPTLISEGFLEESTPYSSSVRTRVVETSAPMAPVTAANQAYSLDGNLTNNLIGSVVVEAVVGNVTAAGARRLSLLVDGELMTSPIGEADLKGRVKFDAIPLEGSGEVHVYLTHR